MRVRLAAACSLMVLALRTGAGPPFLTDDPQPVDLHHWEAYVYSSMDSNESGKAGVLPGLEFNYGAAPNLQLHVILPWAFSSPLGAARTAGFGDISLGLKFRFVQETDTRPQVGIFPMLSVPTGSPGRSLGAGGSTLFLPVWVQKSFGPWTTYGGGGYTINRATGGRNFFSGGWLLQRDLGEKLTLGAEIFAQGRSAALTPGTTLLNGGGQVNLSPHLSLLFSAGASVAGECHRVAYLGLYWTWGPKRNLFSSGREGAAGDPLPAQW